MIENTIINDYSCNELYEIKNKWIIEKIKSLFPFRNKIHLDELSGISCEEKTDDIGYSETKLFYNKNYMGYFKWKVDLDSNKIIIKYTFS